MNCTIKWNTLSIDEWEKRFFSIARSNILQSYTYARAFCVQQKQKARWGLIFVDGREAGLVQMFETGLLWNGIHTVIIDRGPLWFEGFGNAMHIKTFFAELNREFPQRFGRKRRVLPETEDGPAAQKLIAGTGLVPSNDTGYQTIWLDLTQNPLNLRANLKSNWRNKLSKAEKSGLDVEWSGGLENFPEILTQYQSDKTDRGYSGPAPSFLQNYVPLLAESGNLLTGRALKDGGMAAFVLFAGHGRSATYLIGWNSPEGRECAAHHLLLWNGTLMLQQGGIKELDLGGINDESAEGIKVFKEGLGGKNVRYVSRHT